MLIFSDMDISIALAACASGGVVPVYRGIGDDGSQQAVPGIYRFLTFIFFSKLHITKQPINKKSKLNGLKGKGSLWKQGKDVRNADTPSLW